MVVFAFDAVLGMLSLAATFDLALVVFALESVMVLGALAMERKDARSE